VGFCARNGVNASVKFCSYAPVARSETARRARCYNVFVGPPVQHR
jgi:hypothetical protein